MNSPSNSSKDRGRLPRSLRIRSSRSRSSVTGGSAPCTMPVVSGVLAEAAGEARNIPCGEVRSAGLLEGGGRPDAGAPGGVGRQGGDVGGSASLAGRVGRDLRYAVVHGAEVRAQRVQRLGTDLRRPGLGDAEGCG